MYQTHQHTRTRVNVQFETCISIDGVENDIIEGNLARLMHDGRVDSIRVSTVEVRLYKRSVRPDAYLRELPDNSNISVPACTR